MGSGAILECIKEENIIGKGGEGVVYKESCPTAKELQ